MWIENAACLINFGYNPETKPFNPNRVDEVRVVTAFRERNFTLPATIHGHSRVWTAAVIYRMHDVELLYPKVSATGSACKAIAAHLERNESTPDCTDPRCGTRRAALEALLEKTENLVADRLHVAPPDDGQS